MMRGRSNLESKIMSRHRIAREVEEQLHKNLKNEGFGVGKIRWRLILEQEKFSIGSVRQ